MKKVLLLGDSLIEYGDWQEQFPACQGLNFGVAGETVQGLVRRVSRVVDRVPEVDGIVLMTGTNNLAMDDFFFLAEYEDIVFTLRKRYPLAGLVVTGLLPLPFPWQAPETVPRMNILLAALAHRQGAVFCDLAAAFTTSEGLPSSDFFAEDGVHFSAKGYACWAKVLARCLPILASK